MQTSRAAGSGTPLAGAASGCLPAVAPGPVATGFAAPGPLAADGRSSLLPVNLLKNPIQGLLAGTALLFIPPCRNIPKAGAACPSVNAATSCEIYVVQRISHSPSRGGAFILDFAPAY
jgi:hypothetical protein